MARLTQFGTLISMLRNEVGRSNQAGSSGVADYNQIKQLLNRHYETLYLDYDWPHLRRIFDRIPLSAGDRYYDFPTKLDYERVEKVVVWHNLIPLPVERGITFEDYTAYSSEDDVRADPVLKWDVRNIGGSVQIETWPVPASNDQELQIKGFVKFVRLVADADLCLLDDNLVVTFAAAEVAASQGSEDADAKLQAAQRLYQKLKGRTKAAGPTHTFGKTPAPTWPPKNTQIIATG
jgi:hypothetical protein